MDFIAEYQEPLIFIAVFLLAFFLRNKENKDQLRLKIYAVVIVIGLAYVIFF
tara:strand:+ start:4613 stop:4768 length:156 start_codon:yes stop_codon:yes gene_type:complete